MYLGGNGFTGASPRTRRCRARSEVRRAEGGIRAWAAEPGEYYMSLDGQYGGLWRRNGRPPPKLAGVGFTSQGPSRAPTIAACRRRETLGSPGSSTAWPTRSSATSASPAAARAGFELDRADCAASERRRTRSSSPRRRSTTSRSSSSSPEDCAHLTSRRGSASRADKLIRADMVYFETPERRRRLLGRLHHLLRQPLHGGYRNNISAIVEQRSAPLRGVLHGPRPDEPCGPPNLS